MAKTNTKAISNEEIIAALLQHGTIIVPVRQAHPPIITKNDHPKHTECPPFLILTDTHNVFWKRRFYAERMQRRQLEPRPARFTTA